MAASNSLTFEQFQRSYGGLKPYYEYWDGTPVQKSMPTRLHSLVQFLLVLLLRDAGYKAFSELELRVNADWHPIPDVVGLLPENVKNEPYPTGPVDIVVEVLSPDDRLSRVGEKCAKYAASDVKKIIVIDPEHRFGLEWNQESFSFVSICELPNDGTLNLTTLWTRLDEELR
jgi:Uma2 family endonuclease